MSARSTSRYDGPRTGFLDAEPSVNTGAAVNAAVLNHRLGVRWSAGTVGSATRLGRCTPKPNAELKLVVCVTAIGTPDCSVISEVADQSLKIAPRMPGSWWARPAPIGTSQTTDETKTCGISPAE